MVVFVLAVTRVVAARQAFGAKSLVALVYLCVHAYRGFLFAGHLGGFDVRGGFELKAALPPTSLTLVLASALFLSRSGLPAAELLFPQAIASAVLSLVCVALLWHKALSAEAALDAATNTDVCQSQHTDVCQSHLRRLERLTMNVVVADSLEGIQEQICLICLGSFQFGEMLLQLKCKHLHHTACIQSWFMSGGGCPLRCVEACSTAAREDALGAV